MSSIAIEYGKREAFGIEVPIRDMGPDAGWRLACTHDTEAEALNDLRWCYPNRIVKVLVEVAPVEVVHERVSGAQALDLAKTLDP